MTTVNVDIVSGYIGTGVNKATSEFGKLQRQINKLGAAFGVAFSAQRIGAFTSSAIRAAEEDMKAQRLLANQIKNVGLEYAAANSEKYISSLQKQTQILDDDLRPAYIKFLRVTKDVGQAQEMMALAYDTAAGAGIDYGTAVDIIAKAYQGNFKGLKQLNLGLTQAQLNSMTLGQIFKVMGDKFQNAGEQMKTPMGELRVAFADFKESWGTAFSQGFLSTATGGVGDLTEALKGFIPIIKLVGGFTGLFARGLSEIGSRSKVIRLMAGTYPSSTTPAPSKIPSWEQQLKDRAKWEKEIAKAEKTSIYNSQVQVKLAKALKAEQQKSLALKKLSQLLSQAQKAFDNEAITLAAAAQGKLTDEERARLKLKQDIYDLEQAINEENVAKATQVAQTLISDAQYLQQLRSGMLGLSDVPDPFAAWLASLQQILAELAKIQNTTLLPSNMWSATMTKEEKLAELQASIDKVQKKIAGNALTVAPYTLDPNLAAQLDQRDAMNLALGQAAANVNIQINPAVAGLINVIQDTSASGISPTVSRTNSSYIA